jgi:hypothetical protein
MGLVQPVDTTWMAREEGGLEERQPPNPSVANRYAEDYSVVAYGYGGFELVFRVPSGGLWTIFYT